MVVIVGVPLGLAIQCRKRKGWREKGTVLYAGTGMDVLWKDNSRKRGGKGKNYETTNPPGISSYCRRFDRQENKRRANGETKRQVRDIKNAKRTTTTWYIQDG